jgi:hypothetical protein
LDFDDLAQIRVYQRQFPHTLSGVPSTGVPLAAIAD